MEYRIRYAKRVTALNEQGSSTMQVGLDEVVEIKETAVFSDEGLMLNIEHEALDIECNVVRSFINLNVDAVYI